MKARSATVFMVFLLCSAAAIAQRSSSSDTAHAWSIEKPPDESLIVASVGNHAISAEEFLLNYEFGPAFPKRDKDSKRRYLDFMIYEKLLALDGFAKGLDTTADAKLSLAEIEGDLATEELYKDDIVKSVRISEAEISRSMKEERRTISARWIFKSTKKQILEQVSSLAGGITFDSLFSAQCTGTVHREDREMEITRFRLSVKNPVLFKALDTLKQGTVSAPIQAPDGWYLLKLTDSWIDPLSTQTGEMKLHEDVQRVLLQRRCDSLSDRYVEHTMMKVHPTMVRRTLDLLHVRIAKQILPPNIFAEWKLRERLSERWGLADTLLRDAGEPLVKLKKGKFRMQDFLDWYRAREMNLHLPTTSPEALYASLEQLVWRMVRDKLLTERAKARGLQRRATVKRQLKWWKDKIAYNLVKSGIRDSVRWSDDILKAYYAEHQQHFRNEKGEVISFQKAKDDVLREYCSYEVTKRSVHRILELKERYKVVVDEETLRRLHVDVENDPRAIDVYTAKTGGIFPRPAFPVIDYEWEAWN